MRVTATSLQTAGDNEESDAGGPKEGGGEQVFQEIFTRHGSRPFPMAAAIGGGERGALPAHHRCAATLR